MTYGEALAHLGHPFSRPRMRALCVVLTAIDRDEAACDRPGLAALVVRQSDGLPGQGWWIDRRDHDGPWHGPAAVAYLARRQHAAFDAWG